MNIFYIPSWYPSKSNPSAGLFIKEQALAIGKYYQDVKVIISLWGNEETKINLEHPLKVLPHLINNLQDKPYVRQIAPQVFEFNEPVLEWSARLFRGNIKSILKANILNYRKAQKRFGKIDLVHAHVSFPAGFVAMKLAEEFHLPYIITEHMGPFPLAPFHNRQKLMPLLIEPLKKASKVIAVSQKLQSELSQFGIQSTVVPNLVEESYFTAVSQKKHQNFTFFSLGDITFEKGFEDLLKATALVLQKETNVELRIGGEGRFKKRYQKLAKHLKIEKSINWLGFISRKQVLKEFHLCDVFILPSHHESFGMVFLEALSCGKPVIATACGGPEDFVSEDNGLLVDVANVKILSQAMSEIKSNIDNYDSQKIRLNILKNYSSKAVSEKIIKLHKDVI